MSDEGGERIIGRSVSGKPAGGLVDTGADLDMEGDSVETEEGPKPDRIIFKVSTEKDHHSPEGGIVKEVNVGEEEADEEFSPRDMGHNLPPVE